MDASVGANVKVAANTGMLMFYNHKNQSESMNNVKDVTAGVSFASSVKENPDREKLAKKDNLFAKDFNMTPVVISTTKEAYKEAVRKALQNYADLFVAKIMFSKKA